MAGLNKCKASNARQASEVKARTDAFQNKARQNERRGMARQGRARAVALQDIAGRRGPKKDHIRLLPRQVEEGKARPKKMEG
jgi:hypothetical protein